MNYDVVPAKHSGDLIELRDGILELSLIQAKRLGSYAPCLPTTGSRLFSEGSMPLDEAAIYLKWSLEKD